MNPHSAASLIARIRLGALLFISGSFNTANAQFNSGSTGAYGPIDVQTGTVTLPLPDDGIFHCTTITVAAGRTLKFTRNLANTPVYLLATGDITVSGTIRVDGANGGTGVIPGGAGGPGGFDGGLGQVAGQAAPGDGLGPGGGRGGLPLSFNANSTSAGDVGHGGFGAPGPSVRVTNGAPYGSALLIPLVGGSGGGGTTTGSGGDGGGGALLLASSTRIAVSSGALISANGGGNTVAGLVAGSGSGGAVRLVAPRVEGSGSIFVYGSLNNSDVAGRGRVRIDSILKDGLALSIGPGSSGSIGGNMVVFPPGLPKLEIVEAAGQVIDPANNQPVTVLLPAGAPAQQTVKVRATNFGGTAQVKVVLTPEFGQKLTYDLDISGNATGTATVEFPANQLTRVDVWTR